MTRSTAFASAALATAALMLATTAAEAQRRRREPPPPQRPSRADILLYNSFPTGTRLAVTAINGRRPVATDRPAFTFTPAMRMAGFGGCNPVNADYRRNGPSDIRFGPLNFVERKCGGEVDRQERAIFWAIQGANRWRPNGRGGMTFTGVRGTVSFEPAF